MRNNWRAAKAEHSIDEKRVRLRGCGDGSDSEAEVGMGSSFFGMVSPTRAPQATCVHPTPVCAHFPECILHLLPVWGRGLVGSAKHCVLADRALCAAHRL